MTDAIRKTAEAEMVRLGLNKTALGQKADIERSNVSRMLSDRHSISPAWERLLDALDLELMAIPKRRGDVIKAFLADDNPTSSSTEQQKGEKG